jgi:hypothetical protein
VLGLERFFAAFADIHDRAQVDLVEGGEHSGGLLGLDQPARDGPAAARHAHVLFAAGAIGGTLRGGRL